MNELHLVPTDRSNWTCHKQKIEKWNQEFTALYTAAILHLSLCICSLLPFLSWLKPQKMKAAGWRGMDTKGDNRGREEKKRLLHWPCPFASPGGRWLGCGGGKDSTSFMHACKCVIAGEEGSNGSTADSGGTPKFKVAGAPAAERPPSLSQEKHITPLIVFFCFVFLPLPVFFCFWFEKLALSPHEHTNAVGGLAPCPPLKLVHRFHPL